MAFLADVPSGRTELVISCGARPLLWPVIAAGGRQARCRGSEALLPEPHRQVPPWQAAVVNGLVTGRPCVSHHCFPPDEGTPCLSPCPLSFHIHAHTPHCPCAPLSSSTVPFLVFLWQKLCQRSSFTYFTHVVLDFYPVDRRLIIVNCCCSCYTVMRV